MGHVLFHDFCWVLPLQNQPFLECGIETEMGFMGEPDEVGRAVVGVVAVQMMTLVLTSEPVHTAGSNTRDSHKEMAMRAAHPTAHAWVIRMIVRLAAEVLRQVGGVRVQSSGREGVEKPFLRAVQFPVSRTRYHLFAKPQFGAVREIDDLQWQK